MNNFDTIRYDYFVDAGVLFQAFTAGELSVYRELSPTRWASEYDFPAVASGEIVKAEIPHGRPSGMEGFVFNTRRPIFQDWRVRDALLHAFNFEFVNQTLNGGAFPRRASYFANSELGMGTGRRRGGCGSCSSRSRTSLVPGALDAYALPASDGSERNRANMRAAAKQLEAAGWTVQDGVLRNAAGEPFAFEILLTAGQSEAVANIFTDALRQLGIEARVKLVDQAQYNARKNDYDFDMIVNTWNMSLSPGQRADALLGEGRGDGAGDAQLHGDRQPGGGGDDRRDAGDAGPGGVPGGGAGARPGADDRALRDPVLVLGPEPSSPTRRS